MVSKIAVIAVVTIIAVAGVILMVLLIPHTAQFKSTFRKKCAMRGGKSGTCENLLITFQESYVGKKPCNFGEGNYDRLFALHPFDHQCERTMLWSGTEDKVVEWFADTKSRITLARTMLGSVLEEQEWCGIEGSKETFVFFCGICKPNPKTAFWRAASAKFAEYACGHVIAILDGERKEPFHPKTVFASVEVPNLRPNFVTHLEVILVAESNGLCDCNSLAELRAVLHSSIGCSCNNVSRPHLRKCMEQRISPDDCLRSALNSTLSNSAFSTTIHFYSWKFKLLLCLYLSLTCFFSASS